MREAGFEVCAVLFSSLPLSPRAHPASTAADFPGIDGEAMFIGTVLHSLDHTNMAWNLLDTLWLDTSDARFGNLAELGRFVRAGFVDDLPGVCWPRHFQHAPHPFYAAVYAEARKIDEKLARHMDSAIIK